MGGLSLDELEWNAKLALFFSLRIVRMFLTTSGKDEVTLWMSGQ